MSTFQVEKRTDVMTKLIPSSMQNSDCLDSTSQVYKEVLAAGFESYTETNCVFYHFQTYFTHCAIANIHGYNSTAKKGDEESLNFFFVSIVKPLERKTICPFQANDREGS